MLIRTGYEISYDLPAPVAMTLLLYTHPGFSGSLRSPDQLQVTPDIPVQEYTDPFDNRAARLYAPAGPIRLYNDFLVENNGQPDETNWDAQGVPMQDLPSDTLQFLLGSRYCPVQELGDFAWKQFGNTPFGWARVQAVCDWVHNHVRFDYQTARPTKTALDVYNEAEGVCRDFTHLAITLCRCLHLPARYATGYLGDIGVPLDPNPMDFSAWFEVYLGDRWYTFDARHNTPRIGRILMARGRDATDCALTTSFGAAYLKTFTVWTDEVSEDTLSSASPDPSEAILLRA